MVQKLPKLLVGDIYEKEFNVANKLVKLDAAGLLKLAQIVGNIFGLDAAGKLDLSQIGTKTEDLGELWDKTTKIVTGDIDDAEFNVADKLLKLDADAKIPVLQARTSVGADDAYTSDYGLNWEEIGTIASGAIRAMSNLGNGIVIIGDWNGHIYRSTDYGLNWVDLGNITSSPVLASTYYGNGIVTIGIYNKHIYRSTDYGLTWMDLGVIASDYIMTMEYLGNGIALTGDDSKHIFRSTDYGLTWTDLDVIASGKILGMCYLSNGVALIGDDSKHIYRSTDYGLTWADLGVISIGWICSMEYISNGIVIVGDWNGHIYRSTDYGLIWVDLGAVYPGVPFKSAYLGCGVVIIGGSGSGQHIYRSTDYGLTWTDLGAIASGVIRTIEYIGNGIVLMGDQSKKVWRSTSAFGTANFNPNQFDKLFQFGCLGAITTNSTSYLAPGNGATQANEISMRAPRPGILKNLYIQHRVASGAGGRTDIYTVRVNSADKTITCTLDNATQGSDTTHEVLVAAGDRISIKLVSNNASDASADVVATLELT